MADNIQQSFSFDAGQAISELGRLSNSVRDVNASITQLQVTSRGTVETPFANVTRDARQAEAAARKTFQQFKNGGQQAAGAVNEVTVSWQTMARVVQTQLLIRGLNQIRDAFFESADAAEAFQLQAARITAISDLDFGQAGDAVRGLASDLGRGVAEAGEALFEGLQNDLGTTQQTLDLLRGQASDLALLTGGTLPQAVNALSSVIKSYNVDLADAAEITPVLFGAIDAGRITLEDLENSLGTILPLARQVGVTTREVAAGIATITRGGTNAATATTQLRNVFNKAIKPTEDLAAVYRELGVTGFQDLVEQSGGFVEALQAITNQLGNNETAIARAFNTIRGSLGVFNVLRDEGQDYATVMDVIDGKAADVAEAIQTIENTDARRVQRAMADLDVLMTDLGDTSLALKADFLELFLDFIPDAESAQAALAGLGAGAAAAGIQIAGVAAAFGVLAPAAAVLAGTLGTLWAVNRIQEYNESLNEVQGNLAKVDISGKEFAQQEIFRLANERAEEFNNKLGDSSGRFQTLTRSAQQASNEIQATFQETTTGITEGFLGSAETFLGTIDNLAKQIENRLSSLDEDIASLAREGLSLQDQLLEFRFDRALEGASDYEKALAEVARAEAGRLSLLREIENIGSGAAPEDIERLQQLAEGYSRSAIQAARASGDQELLNRAFNAGESVIEANIEANRRFQEELQSINRGEAEDQLRGFQRSTNEIRNQVEFVKDLAQQLRQAEAAGERPELVESLRAGLGDALGELQELVPNLADARILKRFGLDEVARAAGALFEQRLSSVTVDWSNAVQDLQDQLNAATLTTGISIIIEQIEGADIQSERLQDVISGAGASDPLRGTQQQVEAIRQFREEQDQAASAVRSTGVELEKAAVRAEDFFSRAAGQQGFFDTLSIGDQLRVITSETPGLFRQNAQVAQEFIRPFEEGLRRLPEMGAEEAAEFRQRLFQASQQIPEGLLPSITNSISTGIDATLDAVDQRLQQLRSEQLLDEQGLQESTRLLNDLTEEKEVQLDSSDIGEVSTKSAKARDDVASIGENASGAVGSLGDMATNTALLAGQAAVAEDAFRRMAQAARDAASAGGSAGGSVNAYNGGQAQYLANGGSPRGHDRIPAMLDPQEMVINGRQSRNFFSELQAINAGRVTRQEPGVANNITIGDVIVNSSSQVPAQQAREAGISIRRELRRRTFRL